MLCLDSFQTISSLDLKTIPWTNPKNLDVRKPRCLEAICLTNFNVYCYHVIKWCYIVFILYLSKSVSKIKLKLYVPQESTGITG